MISQRHGQHFEPDLKTEGRKQLRKKEVENLLMDLGKINVPAAPPYTIASDGSFTELKFTNEESESIFRWESVPPDGWEELEIIADEMVSLIDDLLPTGS